MPLLPPIRARVDDYFAIGAAAEAKGVSFRDEVAHIWHLGLAAAEAGWQPREDIDNQLVIAGAQEGA